MSFTEVAVTEQNCKQEYYRKKKQTEHVHLFQITHI